MKLTIERVRQFSAQDLIDLGKIWPQQNLEAWQPWLSADHAIFAARFNDRLLAAVKVKISGKTAELSDLLVREVTRRRGVGLYLLEEVQRQLPEIDRWALYSADNDKLLDAFMQACGFVVIPDGWQREQSLS
ncbi:aspartate 1-decarboxylase autocleavage activator PanM [Rouxiella sp. Mn2063]|uniref:aspartate 1-decarboxylase autocleavage activator PanM n=1 Tax=Rouxiella sp. Mn2063 TaxID=3395262 RepID=UPI003BD88912